MTTNRLAKSEAPTRRSPEQWADLGNAILAGVVTNSKGEFETPRHDVHWVVRNGRCVIETPSTAGGR